MKKITIVLALFLLVGLVGAFAQNSYTYDLSKLPATKNAEAFTKNYDDFFVTLPAVDEDLTRYRNVIVRAKCFDENGELVKRGNTKAMVTIYVEPVTADNYDGYRADGNRAQVVKAFNVSNKDNLPGSDAISSNRGERALFRAGSSNPVAIHFQNSAVDIKWLEIEEITFLNPRK